jgi:hypothetical protein
MDVDQLVAIRRTRRNRRTAWRPFRGYHPPTETEASGRSSSTRLAGGEVQPATERVMSLAS